MTNKIEELTPEQEALMEEVVAEYLHDLAQPTPPDGATITRWLDVVYGLYDRKRPERIEIVESPYRALALAEELTGEKRTWTDDCGIGDGGWIAFYDYFVRIGALSKDEASDLLALRDFSRCAWDTVLLDECAIVIQRPIRLRVDDEGNLHGAGEPCIEWASGEKDYAWHGTWVPERIIMDPKSFTRDEYLAITNTEHRRALSENAGWQWVRELLGATSVDKWIDPETKLEYELLRLSNNEMLLQKQSPALKNASQPIYVEPVHEDLRTARAARKWQATDWTPRQCEDDPDLSYGVET